MVLHVHHVALLAQYFEHDLEALVAVRRPPGVAPQLGLPLPRLAVLLRSIGGNRLAHGHVMTADYNGWADQSEEEREALDELEMTLVATASARRRLPALRGLLLRAAAREILARPA